MLDERIAAHRATAPLRTLAAAHVAHLRLLAAAVERADRVRQRTERAANQRLQAVLRVGSAVDADTLRLASAGLLRAERDVAELEAADAPPAGEPEPDGLAVRPTPPPATTPSIPSSGSDAIAVGVLLLSVALSGAIVLTSAPHVLAIGPILLGIFIAGVVRRGWATEERAPVELQPTTAQKAPGRTAYISAPTAYQARAGAPELSVERAGGPPAGLLRARTELGQARLRWTTLAGPDADPPRHRRSRLPHPSTDHTLGRDRIRERCGARRTSPLDTRPAALGGGVG